MKSCETCFYRATHEKCTGCLGEPTKIQLSNGDTRYRYEYKQWVESTLGEALERQHAREVAGECNIVIGGSGEAEVNARWSIEFAKKQLVRVSEMCGYLTRDPFFDGEKAWLWIAGSWSEPRLLVWVSGVFERITKENGVCTWDRHPDFIKITLGKAYSKTWTPRQLIAG